MSDDGPRDANTIREDLWDLATLGPSHATLVEPVTRLCIEVEKLRTALADPAVPELVRASYRRANAQVNHTVHCTVGLTNPTEEILACFFPGGAFAADLAMSKRLGATPEELAEQQAHLKDQYVYLSAPGVLRDEPWSSPDRSSFAVRRGPARRSARACALVAAKVVAGMPDRRRERREGVIAIVSLVQSWEEEPISMNGCLTSNVLICPMFFCSNRLSALWLL